LGVKQKIIILCNPSNIESRERERKEKDRGKVVRDTTFEERAQETISLVFKVPRQCPLVILVEVMP
jgi:hypothetical protein